MEALEKQSYDSSLYRVYVVDNGSTEDIEKITQAFPFVCYLLEQKPGSYNARNKAIASLQSEDFVGFTDSDCIPDQDWIKNAVSCLKHEINSAIGGKVSVFTRQEQPSTLEAYEQLFAFPQQHYIESANFAVTANLFVTRAMLDKVGAFNTELLSGGDADFGQRLHQHGFNLEYRSNVVVKHPARDTIRQIITKIKRTVGGGYTQRHRNDAAGKLFTWRSLVRGFVPPVTAFLKIASEKRFPTQLKVQLCLLAWYFKYYTNGLRCLYKLRVYSSYERC
ncbi:MAG: glycosyltransferase [Aestuariibacter sp.]